MQSPVRIASEPGKQDARTHAPGYGREWVRARLRCQRKVAADELRLARLHDRQDAIEELRLRVLPVQRLKAFPFAPGEDVLRVRERGYPPPVA